MHRLRRRELLATAAAVVGSAIAARAGQIAGGLPWKPNAGVPPRKAEPGGWKFFTSEEATAIEAIADRIIPPDPEVPGGKDAGCAVFVDRQLAGPYGRQEGLYTAGPHQMGTKQQGPQSEAGPAEQYRRGLAALARYCRKRHGGKSFHELAAADQDATLSGLEKGEVALDGVDSKAFFALMVKDIQQGFFADPIYGGNRDMAGWRMIGYPGARYDYREWVGRHNERFPLPPVGIAGSREWNPGKS
jgi:gluconate 2-dehydrogenase gamma chain